MMNQRLSLETNPNPIIEDTAVHPINPTQEEITHSLEVPSQDEPHEEAVYMEPTVEENISTQPARQIFGPLLVDFHVVR